MTAAPLAMVACGLGEDNAALGIQWHVLAMFGPSFFTGTLIARFGKERDRRRSAWCCLPAAASSR